MKLDLLTLGFTCGAWQFKGPGWAKLAGFWVGFRAQIQSLLLLRPWGFGLFFKPLNLFCSFENMHDFTSYKITHIEANSSIKKGA